MSTTPPEQPHIEAVERLNSLGFSRTKPAVAPEHSVEADAIVCLFDGVRRKHLATYLRIKFGITPEEYRSFWNLDSSYPLSVYPAEEKESRVFTPAAAPCRQYA